MEIAAPIKVIILDISDVNDRFAGEDTGGDTSRYRRGRIPMSELGESGWYSPNRNSAQLLTLADKKLAELRSAKPHGLFKHRVKHWCDLAGRGIDDLKNLSGRCLLFEGFARLGDQPPVFYRDDGLICEGADQLDLPLCERFDRWRAR